jgi:FkbM family methyltransferase
MRVLQQYIRRTLNSLGYSVHRNEQADYPDQVRLCANDTPSVVFDLGANRGNTVQRYRDLFPSTLIHAFEPIPQLAAGLRGRFASDPRVFIHECAISASESSVLFNVNAGIDTSSLLGAADDAMPASYRHIINTASRISVDTRTLDGFCSRKDIDVIDILKMDIQGAELYALQGATALLEQRRIRLIYAELFLQPFYEAQPLFGDVAAFLGRYGYLLHGLYNVAFRGGSGKCAWVDAIFVSPQLRARSLSMLAEDTVT